jgi:hypothetical protein
MGQCGLTQAIVETLPRKRPGKGADPLSRTEKAPPGSEAFRPPPGLPTWRNSQSTGRLTHPFNRAAGGWFCVGTPTRRRKSPAGGRSGAQALRSQVSVSRRGNALRAGASADMTYLAKKPCWPPLVYRAAHDRKAETTSRQEGATAEKAVPFSKPRLSIVITPYELRLFAPRIPAPSSSRTGSTVA